MNGTNYEALYCVIFCNLFLIILPSPHHSPQHPPLTSTPSISAVFEVLTGVSMKSYISWYTTSCSLVKVNQHSGRNYHLHLQGQRVSQSRSQHEPVSPCCLLHALPLTTLFFNHEVKVDMFSKTVVDLNIE
jgi:hypothetical protein